MARTDATQAHCMNSNLPVQIQQYQSVEQHCGGVFVLPLTNIISSKRCNAGKANVGRSKQCENAAKSSCNVKSESGVGAGLAWTKLSIVLPGSHLRLCRTTNHTMRILKGKPKRVLSQVDVVSEPRFQ
ncbi:hypothetical protein KCU90_g131, partial [Aureobasidium melanogenum]